MNTETLVTLFVAVFASSGFWSFAMRVYDKKNTKKTIQEEALLALLHDRLYQLAKKYLGREEITVEELNNLKHIWNAYSDLGGNGLGKELYERCLDLPIV